MYKTCGTHTHTQTHHKHTYAHAHTCTHTKTHTMWHIFNSRTSLVQSRIKLIPWLRAEALKTNTHNRVKAGGRRPAGPSANQIAALLGTLNRKEKRRRWQAASWSQTFGCTNMCCISGALRCWKSTKGRKRENDVLKKRRGRDLETQTLGLGERTEPRNQKRERRIKTTKLSKNIHIQPALVLC